MLPSLEFAVTPHDLLQIVLGPARWISPSYCAVAVVADVSMASHGYVPMFTLLAGILIGILCAVVAISRPRINVSISKGRTLSGERFAHDSPAIWPGGSHVMTPQLMTMLDNHLAVDIGWLAATDPEQRDWPFGPGPALSNFAAWIAGFATFNERILLRAILAASSASLSFWQSLDRSDHEAAVGTIHPSSGGESPLDQLRSVRQWIDREADDHPAWLPEPFDPMRQIYWHDTEFRDRWLTHPHSSALWAVDSALHCLLTLHAVTRAHGQNRRRFGTISAIAAANSFRCIDQRWESAIPHVVTAMRSEFAA